VYSKRRPFLLDLRLNCCGIKEDKITKSFKVEIGVAVYKYELVPQLCVKVSPIGVKDS